MKVAGFEFFIADVFTDTPFTGNQLENPISRANDCERLLGATGMNVIAPLTADGRRWKSRMFGPGLGVAEDPATGSAAGPLAVHLARHGRVAWSHEIQIIQGVELQRPSLLYAVAHGGDGTVDSVEVAGDTVIVGRGSFMA